VPLIAPSAIFHHSTIRIELGSAIKRTVIIPRRDAGKDTSSGASSRYEDRHDLSGFRFPGFSPPGNHGSPTRQFWSLTIWIVRPAAAPIREEAHFAQISLARALSDSPEMNSPGGLNL